MRTGIAASLVCLLALVVAGCGGGGGEEPGTGATSTAATGGGAENGKQIFIAQGCGGCHALSAAGTNGTTGPDLDEALKGKDAAFIRTRRSPRASSQASCRRTTERSSPTRT